MDQEQKKKNLLEELDLLFTSKFTTQPKSPKKAKMSPAPSKAPPRSKRTPPSSKKRKKTPPTPKSPGRSGSKHPIYGALPENVYLEGKGADFQDRSVSDLMEDALDDKFAAKLPQLIEKKVAGKLIMLDNAYSQAQHQKASRKEEIERKRNLMKWPKKERRMKQATPDGNVRKKFKDYLGLNLVWNSYIKDIVQSCTVIKQKALQTRILQADLHGCFFTVVESKVPALLHQSGIVIKETKHMFQIITPKNKILLIAKDTSKFLFGVEKTTFLLDGVVRNGK